MALELKHHIELRGDDPLDAVIAGRNLKAYLVANLALNDSPEEAAAHYDLNLADVHAAISFYYHNESAIREADAEAMNRLRQAGMKDIDDLLPEDQQSAS